eukprot:CAMPEP_0115121720 /NCGR_PEP_ID=MMETSP0227-20121206/46405_1 /TAXON_ID=89957 /ORGANISM="Polarella glacialis, Strain CCMP 1383" /LENGTH=258 /DNA_ID=CAMNT_0002523535 /DNA_START=101 /DNA_END=874 /DNA_ORIENTATION=+
MATAVMASPLPFTHGASFADLSLASPGFQASKDLLEQVCSASEQWVSQWRQEQSTAMMLEAQRGSQNLYREQEELEEVQADLLAIAQLAEAAHQLRAEGAEQGEVLRQSMEAAKGRANVAYRLKEDLCAAYAACSKEAREEEALLCERRQAAQEQLANMQQFLALYKDGLGLDISRVAAQTLRVSFTLIDKSDPGREFWLTLGLCITDSAQGYEYQAVDGSCELSQLRQLLERLNDDPGTPAALPAFVCGLRRAFAEV